MQPLLSSSSMTGGVTSTTKKVFGLDTGFNPKVAKHAALVIAFQDYWRDGMKETGALPQEDRVAVGLIYQSFKTLTSAEDAYTLGLHIAAIYYAEIKEMPGNVFAEIAELRNPPGPSSTTTGPGSDDTPRPLKLRMVVAGITLYICSRIINGDGDKMYQTKGKSEANIPHPLAIFDRVYKEIAIPIIEENEKFSQEHVESLIADWIKQYSEIYGDRVVVVKTEGGGRRRHLY